MSTLITNATVMMRKDTSGNWTSNNPTPNQGEWCYETDTGKAKIGDGSTEWASLNYACVPTGLVTGERYDTGWITISDWTDKSFTVTTAFTGITGHQDVLIDIFLSHDGNDYYSIKPFLVDSYTANTAEFYGLSIRYNGAGDFIIRTGEDGVRFTDYFGNLQTLGAASTYYYKVVVTKLTIQ